MASASLSRYKWTRLSDQNRIKIIKTFVDLPLSEQQEMISAVEKEMILANLRAVEVEGLAERPGRR